MVPGAGNSQAWDRYSYGFNNPTRYTDPNGHFPILLAIIAVALILSACDIAPAQVTPVDTPISPQVRIQQINTIADKYGIELPSGVEWGYHDESDYPPELFPGDYGSSNLTDNKEQFGEDTLYDNQVYITNKAFERLNEIQFAGVMVHESRHAWQENSYENGNPLNLPNPDVESSEWRIVIEADAYTVEEDWLQQHGETLDAASQDLADDYIRRFHQLTLNLPLPLPLPSHVK